jgi:hypothetical protein
LRSTVPPLSAAQTLDKPPASGCRIAAGVLSILLGLYNLLVVLVVATEPDLFSLGEFDFGALVLLASGLGSMFLGIVLLVLQRSRGKGAPITASAFIVAGFLLCLGLTGTEMGLGLFVMQLLFTVPAATLLILVLISESKRS